MNDLDGAIIVALGSNLTGGYESLQALLEAAVTAIEAAGLKVVKRSRWWRSAAWPDPDEPAYLNGVLIVEGGLGPAELLVVLHQIEDAFGRRREGLNTRRTLDLDLVAYGRMVAEHPVLPHPRAGERRFVMGPLAEIAPDWRHPVSRMTAEALAREAVVGLDAHAI